MKALILRKRVPKRSRVFLPALVHTGAEVIEARLRDISEIGASLDTEMSLCVGADVEITLEGMKLQAEVTWSQARRFGVRFCSPICIDSMLERFGSRLAVTAPRTYSSVPAEDDRTRISGLTRKIQLPRRSKVKCAEDD